MHKLQKKLILLAIIGIAINSYSLNFAYSAPAIINAGALNTHDMKLLKQQKQLKIQDKNLIELKDKKTSTTKEQEDVNNEKPVLLEKATISEYETKGVYIKTVDFSPSKILKEEELQSYKDKFINKNLFIKDINKVIQEINENYMEKGYVTAKALLPEQTMENGNLKIQLIEGQIGKVNIDGNKWTRDHYVKTRLQQKPDELFDIIELEKNVLNFNRYNDGVKLNTNLTKGETFGTTDINIKTTENIPLHVTGLFDNAGRSSIGVLRGGVIASDESLLGFRDSLSAGAYMSSDSITPFADYSVPINKMDGRLGFTFSSSLADVANGDYSMFNITSRSYNYTLYFNQPLIRKPSFELTSNSSWTYKEATTAFDDVDISTDKISGYKTGISLKYDTKKGIWYGSQDVYVGSLINGDESTYVKLEGNLIRLHDFSHGIVGQFRGNYQWIPEDVIPYADQYQSGGISTTRGYSEGLLIGKSGYLFSAELLFPVLPKKLKIKENLSIPMLGQYIKGILFVDHAGVFPFKGSGPGAEGITSDDFIVGIGPGLRIQLPGDLTARIYWGYPLTNNSKVSTKKNPRFHFELSLSPDFDKILSFRKTKKEKL